MVLKLPFFLCYLQQGRDVLRKKEVITIDLHYGSIQQLCPGLYSVVQELLILNWRKGQRDLHRYWIGELLLENRKEQRHRSPNRLLRDVGPQEMNLNLKPVLLSLVMKSC